jgi:hypothetical protein
MPLNGTVKPAAPGLIGWDTNTKVSKPFAKAQFAKGYRFCFRYLSRATKQGSNDLSAAEAAIILGAGLALGAVQHVAPEGWVATAALGTTNGKNAAANAASVGLPGGMNIWVDLEGVSSASSHQDVIAYCNNWFDAVEAAGYVSGIYVGANAILTGDELFLKLKTRHYWKSGSTVPDIPHRGYQLIQHIDFAHDSDTDVTKTDLLGGQVLWLAP